MKKLLLLLLTVPVFFSARAQTTIHGTVTDQKKEPVPGANVVLKDTYDGATTDSLGHYTFPTDEKGKVIVNITYVGYEPFTDTLTIAGSDIKEDVVLKEAFNELNAVVITAGAFEAGDAGKAVIFSPLDIVTTAGADGDIYGALKTLPGATTVGNDDGLYVRGGSDYETKTIIDGLVVQNPYYSSIPDVPSRGRFAPFLFKGTIFSTGGYSAEYGQAMSSAVILNTEDMPAYSASGLSLSPIFAGAFTTQKIKNTAIGGSLNYTNLYLYNRYIPQTIEWTKSVEAVDGDLYFRQKTSKTGIIKLYATSSGSHLGLRIPSIEDTTIHYDLALENRYNYVNATYKEIIGKKWSVNYGVSYSHNKDGITFDSIDVGRGDQLAETKLTMTDNITEKVTLRFGGEYQNQYNYQNYDIYKFELRQNYEAAFAESDIYITNDLAGRIGIRSEYTDAINKFNIAPRVSLAYQVGKNGQVSVAYGQFYETPQPQYLFDYGTPLPSLTYEEATHYIVNYQFITKARTFRIEGYYKDYDHLVVTNQFTYDQNNGSQIAPLTLYGTYGYGFARGFDVFYRDKKTLKNSDYWISYSFLDAKRKWLGYPDETQPTFAADHVLSVVFKHYVEKITTEFGATYRYISGWPYYNPNNPEFLGDVSPALHDISINASYITQLWGNFTVIFASAGNIFGFDQVYGYTYSSDGSFRMEEVPPAKRTFFIGMFISFAPDTAGTEDTGTDDKK